MGKSAIGGGGGVDDGCDSAESGCELIYISGLGKGISERKARRDLFLYSFLSSR